ncbi:UNVERIFIED_CONTAM: hypothetical protein FKN15_035608 [Acipenser sinensis]
MLVLLHRTTLLTHLLLPLLDLLPQSLPVRSCKNRQQGQHENPWRRGLVDLAMPSEDGKVHNLERRKERESLSPGAALREMREGWRMMRLIEYEMMELENLNPLSSEF